jgi:hypothetical protein
MMLILLLFLMAGLNAQFYEYGQDAGNLHWNQFKTPHYRVIYPRGVDSLAGAFAGRLETYYPFLGKNLDHSHSRMPVIIHNESSFSNGVFVWAPKRLEIFTNPDPNGYNQDWLTQLALHEGRHAVQIDKLNQGFTKGLSILGGEQVVGAMAVFLPYWYLEGDAVDAETRLSGSGRGRQPSFEMGLKAQMLEADRIYSFSKATMGSYKHYIPDHYELGYLMVRYGRIAYGDHFWIDFQQYAARKPFLLNPTFFSMRKYGIRSKSQFYQHVLYYYRDHWRNMDSIREHTPFLDWNSNPQRNFTHFKYPHVISPSLLLAYKTGMDQIPEFILMGKEGQEQKLFRPGYLSSGRVSFSGQYIVWDEFVPDTRWSNRNFSVIRAYEMGTGKVKNLGRKTRYYSPSISREGTEVAVVEQSDLQQFSLVILGLDGKIHLKSPSPGNLFIQHPAWMEGDSAIVLVRSDGEGKSLVSFDPRTGTWRKLMDAGLEDLSLPVVSGNRIFFSATFSGIDNIYCYDMENRKCFQVTSDRFGAFQPQVSGDGSSLFYARYTSQGFRIAELELDQGLWKPLRESINHEEQVNYRQTWDEKVMLATAALPDTASYETSRYRKIPHLFHFHSWLPLYVDYLNPDFSFSPEHIPVSPGVSLISQNHLSTAVSQLGYEYRNGYHMLHTGIMLKGRYPVVNLFFDYGGEPDVLLFKNEADTAMALPQDMGLNVQVYIPFRLNTGKYLSLIQPRIDYQYKKDLQYIEEEDAYRQGAHYLYYSLQATSYLRMGQRDIIPRLGFSAFGGYYHAPFDHRVYGAVSIAGITAYLPGFAKHHSFRIAVQTQKQYPIDINRPAFINLMSLPRSRYGIFGETLTRYSADYMFPIFYPDLQLTALLYLKRIRGALWTDYMDAANVIVQDPHPHLENRTYPSVGIDLVADFNVFRIPFPISAGARLIYELDTGKPLIEWIYSIEVR